MPIENDPLHSFIHDNQELFDENPPEGLWERIENELDIPSTHLLIPKRKPWYGSTFRALAASVSLLFVVSFSVYFVLPSIKISSDEASVATDEKIFGSEFIETESIYLKQINHLESKWDSQKEVFTPEDQTLMETELKRLEEEYLQIKEQASVEGNPKVLLDNLITNLKARQEILNSQLMYLKELKSAIDTAASKTTTHTI